MGEQRGHRDVRETPDTLGVGSGALEGFRSKSLAE